MAEGSKVAGAPRGRLTGAERAQCRHVRRARGRQREKATLDHTVFDARASSVVRARHREAGRAFDPRNKSPRASQFSIGAGFRNRVKGANRRMVLRRVALLDTQSKQSRQWKEVNHVIVKQ